MNIRLGVSKKKMVWGCLDAKERGRNNLNKDASRRQGIFARSQIQKTLNCLKCFILFVFLHDLHVLHGKKIRINGRT